MTTYCVASRPLVIVALQNLATGQCLSKLWQVTLLASRKLKLFRTSSDPMFYPNILRAIRKNKVVQSYANGRGELSTL